MLEAVTVMMIIAAVAVVFIVIDLIRQIRK